ncbi:hypothetical protein BC834DRAFT_564581 [Gloeopeniophorella convolvens]|nr:hypothetical protein BC834DRAFT_564581 [Gloeopeniophorella convolvens]
MLAPMDRWPAVLALTCVPVRTSVAQLSAVFCHHETGETILHPQVYRVAPAAHRATSCLRPAALVPATGQAEPGAEVLRHPQYRLILGDLEVFGLDTQYWHKLGGFPSDSVILRDTESVEERLFQLMSKSRPESRPRKSYQWSPVPIRHCSRPWAQDWPDTLCSGVEG